MNLPNGFPFDLITNTTLPGKMGALINRLKTFSLVPPYPWGQWIYGQLLQKIVTTLPGDMIECGVGRGGMSLFLATMCKQYLHSTKKVYTADTFNGLGTPRASFDTPYFKKGDYKPSISERDLLDEFILAAKACGVDDIIKPLKGNFNKTLSTLPAKTRFAFIHIDADLYNSVKVCLDTLYDRLVPGGILVIDDYFHPADGPKRAAAEFFNSRNITPIWHISFPYSVFCFKDEAATNYFKTFDGCYYSLSNLKKDPAFKKTLTLWRGEWERRGDTVSLHYARELSETLAIRTEQAGEMYRYWAALTPFWNLLCRPRQETDALYL